MNPAGVAENADAIVTAKSLVGPLVSLQAVTAALASTSPTNRFFVTVQSCLRFENRTREKKSTLMSEIRVPTLRLSRPFGKGLSLDGCEQTRVDRNQVRRWWYMEVGKPAINTQTRPTNA